MVDSLYVVVTVLFANALRSIELLPFEFRLLEVIDQLSVQLVSMRVLLIIGCDGVIDIVWRVCILVKRMLCDHIYCVVLAEQLNLHRLPRACIRRIQNRWNCSLVHAVS